MAVHVKIDLEGALDELLRRAQPALEEAARRCQRRAQDYCPVAWGSRCPNNVAGSIKS
jgi:hypothetical protein